MAASSEVRIWAPGRVNLIGDHTDHTGGLVLPMAIDLGVEMRVTRGGNRISLTSDQFAEPAELYLPIIDAASTSPTWGRLVAAVAAELHAIVGMQGSIHSTLPVGSGLSSSAAVAVATALALGASGPLQEVAEICRRAETKATGVPCGIMDQLASLAGREGHALLIDCHSMAVHPVPIPAEASVVVVHSGTERELASSAYATRVAQCTAVESLIGPLRLATPGDLAAVGDPVLVRRARHVITENRRVRRFAEALEAGDLVTAGLEMTDSHHSLAEDFQVSTPALDMIVGELTATDGVYGARMTGAGFGGCVVALCAAGTEVTGPAGVWRVHASAGASALVT